MKNEKLDSLISDLSHISMGHPLSKLVQRGDLEDHPSLFLMSIHNKISGKIETDTFRTDEIDEVHKFRELIQKATGKEFKVVELPLDLINYASDIAISVKDGETPFTKPRLERTIQGSLIKYLDIGASRYSWKHLTDDIEFEIRYLKGIVSQKVVDANAVIVIKSVDETLKRIDLAKAAILEACNKYGLYLTPITKNETITKKDYSVTEGIPKVKKSNKSAKP